MFDLYSVIISDTTLNQLASLSKVKELATLGDVVITKFVIECAFKLKLTSGLMTSFRQHFTTNDHLSSMIKSSQFWYLIFDVVGPYTNKRTIATVVEALFAVIYLDCGESVCVKFFNLLDDEFPLSHSFIPKVVRQLREVDWELYKNGEALRPLTEDMSANNSRKITKIEDIPDLLSDYKHHTSVSDDSSIEMKFPKDTKSND